MKKFFRTIFTIVLVAVAFVIGSIVGGDGLGIGAGIGIIKSNGENNNPNGTDVKPTDGVTVTVDPDGSVVTEYDDNVTDPVQVEEQQQQSVNQSEEEDVTAYVWVEWNDIYCTFKDEPEVHCTTKDEFRNWILEVLTKNSKTKFFVQFDDSTSLKAHEIVDELMDELKNDKGVVFLLEDTDIMG